jgi:cytidine deaminase
MHSLAFPPLIVECFDGGRTVKSAKSLRAGRHRTKMLPKAGRDRSGKQRKPLRGGMDRELFEAARAVRERAYAPYSRFPVGAALRTEAGTVHAGCNVENAAYPEGCCAETAAIAAMIAASSAVPERRIAAICVVAESVGGRLTTPCGGCRQRIAELAGPDAEIHVADPDGTAQVFHLRDLLPAAFGTKRRP